MNILLLMIHAQHNTTVADSAIDIYADDSSLYKTGKQIPRCTDKSSA